VQIQTESSDVLGLDSLMSEAGGGSGFDPMEANLIIETQATILQSDTLALRTIEKLHMEGTQDFRPHWSPVGWLFGLFSPRGVADAPGVRLEDAPGRRSAALATFARNLKVKPISGTRLIEVDYLNPDPKLAAAVVNELIDALVTYTFETRYNATNQASNWLGGQLTELRQQSEDLQAKVVNLERQSGVYSLGTVDAQGREQQYSGVLDQLQQSTIALTQVEQNRILKGAIKQAADAGDAEMLSGLAGNSVSSGGSSQSMNSSLNLIQSLRQQEATEQAMLQEAEAKYGPSYPKLAEIRGNLAGLDRSIQDEVSRIRKRAESDYAVAVQAENSVRAQFELAKAQADKLNDKAIEYAIVRQEADQSRGLYEDMLKRLKEAGVLQGLKSSNITVVDPGRVPSSPMKPNVPLYMIAALGGGFFLGSLAALLVETLDNRISSTQEVEQLTGQSLFGATPLIEDTERHLAREGRRNLTALYDPLSTYAEAMRSIRTAVLLTGGGDHSRVILVTSSIPQEGKTTISANLAAVLAQSNRKVLLVDLDMRRGALRHTLGLPAATGLSELLAGQRKEPLFAAIEGLPSLDVLQSGTPPPNPSELLDLKIGEWLAAWRANYDYIVLDAPPLLPVTDAQIVHPFADLTLLLSRSGLTERSQLKRSYRLLTDGSRHFVGVILNGLRPEDNSYYGFYGYRKYSYSYGGDGSTKS
jgi:capsular exopolysaccharide synthesis family protein